MTLESGAVATYVDEGVRLATTGRDKDHAVTRLRNRLYDIHSDTRIFPEDTINTVTNVPLAGLFYVEYCYNGEELTDERFDEFRNVLVGDIPEMWGHEWKEQIRRKLDE